MGNSCFKALSADKLLEMTNNPNFCKLVRREHAQVMAVPLKGTFASFSREENNGKNRFSNIPCWDHSRVIINCRESAHFDDDDDDDDWDSSQIVITSEETASTYIHANYVDGFNVIKKYICTETPMENLWKLIWRQKSRVIVSLTDTEEDDQDSYKYWVNPEGSEVTSGRYLIKTLEIKEEISFTRTRRQITNATTETSQEIIHFWFTDWPDSSIPTGLQEFLNLRTAVNREQYRLLKEAENGLSQPPGPIVVQCSTGVGWTGTFCAIDNALAQLDKEKKVSLPQTVLKIRSQRHSSVYLPEQYAFCYKVLEHVLLAEKKKQTAELIPDNKRFGVYIPNSRRNELKVG